MSKLSDYLRILRKNLNMTQAEMAHVTGVAPDSIGKYELGKRTPKLKVLLRYSRICHISIYKLVDLQIEDIKGGEVNDTNKNS